MNGRLSKVDMTDKLLKLKRELDYKCEIGEMGEWECVGANKYLNKTFEAARNAREDVPYLHEHPFSLEYIKEIK